MASGETAVNDGSKKISKKRKCSVHDVFLKNKTKVEPVFVDFANGRPLDSKALTTTLYRNTSDDVRRQRRRILSVETQKLQYTGTNFGADAFQNNNTSTFLGILDKNTGKMVVVEASDYCVRPLLESSRLKESNGGNDNLSFLEKQEAVANAFGSKRSKQAVARKKQFQVDAESMSGAINQAVTNTEVDSKTVGQGWNDGRLEALLTVLPPCNREADSVESVYNLEDIAPDYFLVHLQNSAEEFLKTDNFDRSFSSLVVELLIVAKGEQDETKRLRKCCLSLYIHHLLSFLQVKGHELDYDYGLIMKGCPLAIKKHLFREYTQGKFKKSRTRGAEDKVLCLVLVLALIVNYYHISRKTLLQSLPLNNDRLAFMMKLIGATYRSGNQDYKLKLPLAEVSQNLPVLGRKSKMNK